MREEKKFSIMGNENSQPYSGFELELPSPSSATLTVTPQGLPI